MNRFIFEHVFSMLWLTIFFVLSGSLSLDGDGARPLKPIPEPQLKAQFIERFIHFVEWPEPLHPPSSKEKNETHTTDDKHTKHVFHVCVYGETPVTEHLQKLVENKQWKGLQAKLDQITELRSIQQCHVLLISSSEENSLSEIIESVNEAPVLTISEIPHSAEAGVMISFYRKGKYLRFEVNLRSLRKSKLKMSSKLLQYARLVEER